MKHRILYFSLTAVLAISGCAKEEPVHESWKNLVYRALEVGYEAGSRGVTREQFDEAVNRLRAR